ncbi:hypothetical protein [Paraburkholderia caribensis]|uniref:hypothetical protein n=1 Tax=Paraburkholderia caribensis TaxID=75105 RepID=UPI00078D223C|nr:hypothetical protein [Paraburkholderia caribensis]AMV48230.1 hypothetical protein ATN79_47055 [Paraburkholderia caribensis]
MSSPFVSVGNNAQAPFTLKLHRGESMVLIAMNWRSGEPPDNFVGWFISYREPDGNKFYPLKNRLGFTYQKNQPSEDLASTEVAPIQKFRWVHFPYHAEKAGTFRYRVVPVYMDTTDALSYGDAQEAESTPTKMNSTLPSRADSYPRRHSWTDTKRTVIRSMN